MGGFLESLEVADSCDKPKHREQSVHVVADDVVAKVVKCSGRETLSVCGYTEFFVPGRASALLCVLTFQFFFCNVKVGQPRQL